MALAGKLLTYQLPLMEAFYTIQGEGFHQGRAAYFIRLAGCDVGCFWCDVKESWDANLHPIVSINEMVKNALEYPARLAVITGGEPLLHNLDLLTQQLQEAGFETNIETSGSNTFSGHWNWICVSPKKFKLPTKESLDLANELKIIVYNLKDFEWAEQYAEKVNKNCKLYLQPEWERSSIMTPHIVDYIRNNPKWELSIQLHKYIHVP